MFTQTRPFNRFVYKQSEVANAADVTAGSLARGGHPRFAQSISDLSDRIRIKRSITDKQAPALLQAASRKFFFFK